MKPSPQISTIWTASRISTADVLPVMSTERGSAVAPRRLSTPYLRSNPVPIASPVNAELITARARMLGTTKSMRRPAE